jgi:methylmalonyl-CoA decarboxylase
MDRGRTSGPVATNEIRDRIGILTLDDPERRNCLSPRMLDEITAGLVRFAEHDVRVVVIRARAKVWSSGLDVRSLPEPGRDPLDYSDPLEHVIRQVEHFPAPVIAMVEGGVWGGACDLATVCDLAIGSETASFAITPAKLGVPYNCSGILHFLNLLGPRVAREMFFTAEPIRAERALQVGILNHLVPAAELEEFTFGMARRIAENSPLAVGIIKEQLRILARSHPISPDTFERIQTLRRAVYESADYVEGKRAFLEKRKPVFTGEGTRVCAGAKIPEPAGV